MDMYTYVRNEKPIYHIDLLSLIGESSIAIVILNLGGHTLATSTWCYAT